ncbi:hypothetical protein ABL78_5038 [Leptomonas seymouri]|uniref:Inosine/uridine-preferring nucleoside hydrolase domain-containing protein n=1 Tax=Leptomonas seymouri TaxID=5684 RepID=A0A0N0P506_LEPSE|nr:hypothetical protein ABL78_5038 [Leptomonas seymouri]|eukprot:KPI85906.1 hypothetical protein ABL78_5038 [Leptomonas seymouri]
MDQLRNYYEQWAAIPQPRKVKTLKLTAFICYFLFFLLLIIYAFGRTGQKTASITPFVLFTDGTPYNLQVVRYMAQRRDVVISMIVVSTNTLASARLNADARIVQNLVNALQSEGLKTHVPEVYASYNASTNSFPEPLDAKLAKTKASFLIIGPCTDAAYFLQKYAERRANVNSVYVAGGAFNAAGNANYFNSSITGVERNFYMDPSAADYVMAMKHGRPVVMLPLDATLAWSSPAYNAIVSSPASSESAVTVARGLRWYYENVDKTKRVTVGIAAAAYASDTQVQTGVTVTSIPVRVYTSAADARYGRSYRPPASADEKKVTVVLSLVESTFFRHVINVNGLSLA